LPGGPCGAKSIDRDQWQQGRIATLGDHLPGYEAWAAITIRQLLGMQSGIPDYLTVPALMLDVITDSARPYTPEEILAYVEAEPLLYTPGEGANYSNSNYLLLGLLIEAVTGETAAQVFDQRLITPLGLTGTALDTTLDVPADFAHGYMDLSLVGWIFGVPPEVLAFIPEDAKVEGSIVDATTLFHPTLTWTAGALISTTTDMATFVRALNAGDLLEPATLELMRTVHEVPILGSPVPYGLGLQVRPTSEGDGIGHGGLNFGYQAGTYTRVDHGVTFSHMHNFLPEQSDGFQGEGARALVEGPGEPVPDCAFGPETFFDAGGEQLELRFKGPVNAANAAVPVPGVGTMSARLAEGVRPLYGFGTQASYKQQGLQARLEVESLAPANEAGAQLVVGSVSIDPTTFTKVDEQGRFEASATNPGALFATVGEMTLKPGTTDQPQRFCFVAVSDLTRPARMGQCGPTDAAPEPGQTLRIFATLPLTTDATVIELTLKQLSLPVCLCWDDQGQVGACPEE